MIRLEIKELLKQIILGIITVGLVLYIGYEIIHNTHTFQEDCINQNKTMYLSYNDTECGCKWYNLCDHGCLICKETNE